MNAARAIDEFASQAADGATAIDLLKSFLIEKRVIDVSSVGPSLLREFLGCWYPAKFLSDQNVPPPRLLINSCKSFFLHWIMADDDEDAAVLDELEDTLPRAIEITNLLARSLRERRGPFGFAEFLTTFEQGGQSHYDIDSGGEIPRKEGYFKVVRVEAIEIAAEELISEELFSPISITEEVGALLEPGYILNLEIARVGASWEIIESGLAHPPGSPVLG